MNVLITGATNGSFNVLMVLHEHMINESFLITLSSLGFLNSWLQCFYLSVLLYFSCSVLSFTPSSFVDSLKRLSAPSL